MTGLIPSTHKNNDSSNPGQDWDHLSQSSHLGISGGVHWRCFVLYKTDNCIWFLRNPRSKGQTGPAWHSEYLELLADSASDWHCLPLSSCRAAFPSEHPGGEGGPEVGSPPLERSLESCLLAFALCRVLGWPEPLSSPQASRLASGRISSLSFPWTFLTYFLH